MGFSLSLENTFLEKPHGVWGSNWPPPTFFRLNLESFGVCLNFQFHLSASLYIFADRDYMTYRLVFTKGRVTISQIISSNFSKRSVFFYKVLIINLSNFAPVFLHLKHVPSHYWAKNHNEFQDSQRKNYRSMLSVFRGYPGGINFLFQQWR